MYVCVRARACVYIYIHTRTMISHTVRFQLVKQPMNQFSNTQRSIITFAYDEMLRTFVSNKLSPISILLYVAAVYMN